eukprot:jgi/Tetstr1/434648/TSEL_023739.t1
MRRLTALVPMEGMMAGGPLVGSGACAFTAPAARPGVLAGGGACQGGGVLSAVGALPERLTPSWGRAGGARSLPSPPLHIAYAALQSRRKVTHKSEEGQRQDPELRRYWEEVLEHVDRQAPALCRARLGLLAANYAQKYVAELDMDYQFGCKPGVTAGSIPCYEYYLDVKSKHPRAVHLVQIGKFYEAIGVDAILLMNFCSLNAMGNKPRAGAPLSNITQLVNDLIFNRAGITLDVVISEEISVDMDGSGSSYGFKGNKNLKHRAIVGVCNQASPNFDRGLMARDPSGENLAEARPMMALAATSSGFQIYEVDIDMRTIRVSKNQTRETVDTRIQRGGICPPLYLHESIHASAINTAGGARTRDSQQDYARMRDRWKQTVPEIHEFGGANALQELQNLVVMRMGWDATDTDKPSALLTKYTPSVQGFRVTTKSTAGVPLPLYLSTASQLGLVETRGVPGLLDSILPKGSRQMMKLWMLNHLLEPPSPPVAMAVNQATNLLLEGDAPMPGFPLLRPPLINKLIIDQEVSAVGFRLLTDLCTAVVDVFQNPGTAPFAEQMLVPTSRLAEMELSRRGLVESCQKAIATISAVVPDDTEAAGQSAYAPALPAEPEELQLRLGEFFTGSEACFRGWVRRELFEEELNAVEAAAKVVIDEMCLAIESINAIADASKLEPKHRGFQITADPGFQMLSKSTLKKELLKERKEGSDQRVQRSKFLHPQISRGSENGKMKTSSVITTELDKAVDDYLSACGAAQRKVVKILKTLANELQGAVLLQLIAASWFAVGCQAMISHVEEGRRRRWTLPTLDLSEDIAMERTQQRLGPTPGRRPLELRHAWPYWMNRLDSTTVLNSVSCNSMLLLTGPNMAGKSTVLRTVAATSLLGAAGLMAPCESGRIPYLDAFILRTFSQDSPGDAMSSYGVECQEMAAVQDVVTQHTLLLVDELGKGTEVASGTAVAAALLEDLHQAGCRGIFATHLHGLLTLEGLDAPSLQRMQMETRPMAEAEMDEERRALAQLTGRPLSVPTWRMVEGWSTESLALSVALDQGMRPGTVRRAAELQKAIQSSFKAAVEDSGLGGDGGAASAQEPMEQRRQSRASAAAAAARVAGPVSRPSTAGGASPQRSASELTAALEGWVREEAAGQRVPATAPECLSRFLGGESVASVAANRARPIKETTVVSYILGLLSQSVAEGQAGAAPGVDWERLAAEAGLHPGREAVIEAAVRDGANASLDDALCVARARDTGITPSHAKLVALKLIYCPPGSRPAEPALMAAGGSSHPGERDPLAAAAEEILVPPLPDDLDHEQQEWYMEREPSSAPTSDPTATPPASRAGTEAPRWVRSAPGESATSTKDRRAGARHDNTEPRDEAAGAGVAGAEPRGIADAGRALKEVCSHLREAGALPAQPTPVVTLARGRQPPPRHAMTSCVYVCAWDSGYFYCGETDDIKTRIKAHSTSDRHNVTRGRAMEVAYVPLASKSSAREVEAALQRKLRHEGFPMLSTADAAHRNFGRA